MKPTRKFLSFCAQAAIARSTPGITVHHSRMSASILPRPEGLSAATVAVAISHHDSLSPRVLIQRAMETAPLHFCRPRPP